MNLKIAPLQLNTSQYLSRIEGSPPKRNVAGSIPVWDATNSAESLIFQGFQRFRKILPWQINNTLIIFLYLHLSLVFLLKRLIFQGFPTFEFSFLFKVSSQIFSYFLMLFPAILVNPLVKQASLPTGFFNYSLSDILLPLHHQNSHGCKCSRLH